MLKKTEKMTKGGGRRPRTTDQNSSLLNSKTPIHHPVDLDEKPLLYDYYANTLNPIIDRRNFDEIDQITPMAASHLGKRSIDETDRYNKRFFLERSRTLPTLQEQQQQQQHKFHEVDKADYQDYMKRMLNDDRIMPAKRNFDEIDRFGLNRFVSPYHMLWNKRNFDEIDRLVPQIFTTDNKREEMGNGIERNAKFMKFV